MSHANRLHTLVASEFVQGGQLLLATWYGALFGTSQPSTASLRTAVSLAVPLKHFVHVFALAVEEMDALGAERARDDAMVLPPRG